MPVRVSVLISDGRVNGEIQNTRMPSHPRRWSLHTISHMKRGVLLLLAAICAVPALTAEDYLVYFGTYTGPKSKGIYVSTFDTNTGKLSPAQLAGETVNPSWVAIHPSGRFLYSVSELGKDGILTSFAIDKSTGKLTELNKVSTDGRMACHLAIDKSGQTIYVANYGDGSVAGFRLSADGKLGERTAFIRHEGSGPDTRRQRGPHAHAVVLSPDGKFLVVPDLGTDQYFVYRTGKDGGLTPSDPAFAKVAGGLGPRHFAFHPGGKYGFGLNEMGSRVTAFGYRDGVLQERQTISTIPSDLKTENNSAEIEVDQAGRFVYASNRGDDSIAVFVIDAAKGTLTNVQRVPTQGKNPRNFKLAPGGKYLLAANQNSDSVVAFSRDAKSGKLTPAGQVLDVPSPVCIQFVRK